MEHCNDEASFMVRRTLRRLSITTLVVSSALLLPFVSVGGAASSHTSKNLVVSDQTISKFGTILVSGRTLYTLVPSATPCTVTCLKYWPALLLPKGDTRASAGRGVVASKLGTVKRAGGRLQVTYGGKPLYWFFKDTAPGQVHGNLTDTWGTWSVVVIKKTAPSSTTTTDGGGTTSTTSPNGGGIGF